MKTTIDQIEQVIKSNRLIINRIKVLTALGYDIKNKAMGSGGVGQIKRDKKGNYYLQISTGIGRHNYAYVVVIDNSIE